MCGRPSRMEHARLVDHLVAQDDHARGLDDLVAVVVDDRQQRSQHAAGDALVVEAPVLVRVGGAARGRGVALRDQPLRAFRRLRRHAPVGRIDNERGLVGRPAAFEPVRRGRYGAPDRAARFLLGRHLVDRELRVVLVVLPGERRLARLELLVGEQVALTEVRRSLQRHADHVRAGPEALQVGIAPCRAGDLVFAVRLKPDDGPTGRRAARPPPRQRSGGAASAS